jgi:diacylglycerol kinase (ATP)
MKNPGLIAFLKNKIGDILKTSLLINPSSAGGRALESKKKIESCLNEFGIEYIISITKNLKHMLETIKSNLSSGFDNFIAVGGDGTLHHMVNMLAESNKRVGIIPLGSGNDISANLGIPSGIEDCCRIIKQGKIKNLDLGIINDKYYYICIAGAGFDSEVTDLANSTRFPLKGSSKYTYAVYKTLVTFRSKEFTFYYDGKVKKFNGMMIAASNMPSYGGGMKITPDASPSDGLLDICIIKKMSKFHFIKVFPKVFQGKHTDDPHVEIFRTSKISIESNYNFSVFADGEFICKLPATFKIASGKLNFIVP